MNSKDNIMRPVGFVQSNITFPHHQFFYFLEQHSNAVYHNVLYSVQCRVLYYIILYSTVLYCTVLYCIVLYCTVQYCNVLYCTLYSIVLYCNVVYYTVSFIKVSRNLNELKLDRCAVGSCLTC